MHTQCNPEQLEFSAVGRRRVVAAFDGGTVSSDAGALLLGKTDAAIALTQAGIQLDPSVPALHRDLGSFLERSGRLLEASAAYADYARLAPNAPDVGAIKDRASALAQQASTSSP